MDEQFSRLKEQIDKIKSLKNKERWGPEFQLWEVATEKLVKETFGNDGLGLFQQQQTRVFSYVNEGQNQQQYLKELDDRKRILEGLLTNTKEFQSKDTHLFNSQSDILKEIWRKESALKENLLTVEEARVLQKSLLNYMDSILLTDSIPSLRFRKLKAERRFQTWWANEQGYPAESPWYKIEPFLKILEQYEAEKTIKKRLETEGLFVESRSQGEDQHLLIGDKNDNGEKAHIIIDGKNAEIRIEDTGRTPEELVKKIETILTLPSGKQIRTTRESIEEI